MLILIVFVRHDRKVLKYTGIKLWTRTDVTDTLVTSRHIRDRQASYGSLHT